MLLLRPFRRPSVVFTNQPSRPCGGVGVEFASVALVGLLSACAVLPPQFAATNLAMDVADTPSQAAITPPAEPGRALRWRPDQSAVRIYVYRAGRAGRLGHNHVLTAPHFEGDFFFPEAGPNGARFGLRFRLDELVLDAPQARAAAGPAFASEVSPAAVAATRAHMLGPDNMQADAYPVVQIQSLAIRGEAPRFAVQLEVVMHGQTRVMWVPVMVTGLPTKVRAQGALVLRQTDFGIAPYSVMNGFLAVEDAVQVEFELVGE